MIQQLLNLVGQDLKLRIMCEEADFRSEADFKLTSDQVIVLSSSENEKYRKLFTDKYLSSYA
ncbi:hypothetical protein DF186_25195, partial [Enterococcus hirae]